MQIQPKSRMSEVGERTGQNNINKVGTCDNEQAEVIQSSHTD